MALFMLLHARRFLPPLPPLSTLDVETGTILRLKSIRPLNTRKPHCAPFAFASLRGARDPRENPVPSDSDRDYRKLFSSQHRALPRVKLPIIAAGTFSLGRVWGSSGRRGARACSPRVRPPKLLPAWLHSCAAPSCGPAAGLPAASAAVPFQQGFFLVADSFTLPLCAYCLLWWSGINVSG